jgi:hypothetical protein
MSTSPTPSPTETTIPREIPAATRPVFGGSNGSGRPTLNRALNRTGTLPAIQPARINPRLRGR